MRIQVKAMLATMVLALGSLGWTQTNELPVNWKELPPPFHTESARNEPEVISRPDNAELKLPDGFVVEEYLSGFGRPRFMMLGPSQEILLTDSGSRDTSDGIVYVLKDGSRTELIGGLKRPYGLALNDGWL